MPRFHHIPKSIKSEVETALGYFPSLAKTRITFKFKKRIKKATMLAQPTWDSFLKTRKYRSYVILISEKFQIHDQEFVTKDIPSEVFIGWIGHELGHLMDYQNRSKLNLIWFGIRYLFFDTHRVEAERTADWFAVAHNMEDYILKTKNFILNHADITEAYKKRIKRYYLSPQEIMHLVAERNQVLR